MRKFVLSVLVLLLSFSLKAQSSFSLGVRQGIGVWFTKTGFGKGSLQFAEGDHFSWNKEIFVRQPFNKKWAYEVSIAHYQLNSIHTDVRDYKKVITERDANFIETGLSFQYDVTYPLAGYMVPALKEMKSYIGFALVPRFSFEQITTTTEGNDAISLSSTRPANNFALFVGFSYTQIIPLTQRLSFTAVVSFKMNPFSNYGFKSTDYSNPNRQVSLATGLSYRL